MKQSDGRAKNIARAVARNAAKAALAKALTEAGAPSFSHEAVETLRTRAHRVFGPQHPAESTEDYVLRVTRTEPKAQAAGSGVIAAPRTIEPIKAEPLKLSPLQRYLAVRARAAEPKLCSNTSAVPARGRREYLEDPSRYA